MAQAERRLPILIDGKLSTKEEDISSRCLPVPSWLDLLVFVLSS
jgi:hypothetical protein